MNLTDKQLKILETIKELGIMYSFPEVDKGSPSYLEEYGQDNTSIRKLTFSTIPELIDLLDIGERTIRSKKCDALCAVEAFKNKPQYSEGESDNLSGTATELPEYIYNF